MRIENGKQVSSGWTPQTAVVNGRITIVDDRPYREIVADMIRAALVAHHVEHGVILPSADEFIDALANELGVQHMRESIKYLVKALEVLDRA